MNVSVSKEFNAPQPQVWAVLTDIANTPHHLSAVKSAEVLTDGPIGKGTRFRETRVMMKREATEEMEITEWNPPDSFVVEADSCGARFTSVISCTPAPGGEGAIVEMRMAVKPVTFMAKLMSPLSKMMAGTCRKAFEQDLEELKQVVEGRVAAQPA